MSEPYRQLKTGDLLAEYVDSPPNVQLRLSQREPPHQCLATLNIVQIRELHAWCAQILTDRGDLP